MVPFVQARNISKFFHNVVALDDVSVDFNGGEIHVVIGENGAGKSTLMNVIAGLFPPDKGTLLLDGRETSFANPQEAIQSGVSMIHQELLLVPYLTVAENIFLGREPVTGLGTLNKKLLHAKTRELLDSIGIDIDPYARMNSLSVAQKQLAEIAKAVSFKSKILIMDEPTSAISDREVEHLYNLIYRLKAEGAAIVFISHKIEEVFKVADKITVLRDGRLVHTGDAGKLDKDKLITMMIGRELSDVFVKEDGAVGEPVLEVRNLTKKGNFRDVSFTLRQGEILGIAGLMGAGRTELVETIFGLRKPDSGEIFVKGKKVAIKSAYDAQKNGIAMIPEDRKLRGLNLKNTTGFNISLCDLKNLSSRNVINKKAEVSKVNGMIKEMNVKVTSHKTPVVTLSGGNQQKVVVAKWLMTDPEVLIMDEPTRGIDVGAKAEIYKLITRLARAGKSIIMVSSELPEIVGLSDRIIVLCEGRKTGELSGDDRNQMAIMKCATNT
jgi:ABC-type sugar transport system ATPase subunit